MFRKNMYIRGQSITEYVIVVGIVSLALIGLQTYMKRGIQAVIKGAADEVGNQKDAEDIDPLKGTTVNSQFTTQSDGSITSTVLDGGTYQRTIDRASQGSGISKTEEKDKVQ